MKAQPPRKTWIKVKRGLLEPKHRKKLGARIWLYLYILDITDWETGKITGWTDAYHAERLDMPYRTVQDQRQRLEQDGYITTRQTFQSIEVTVVNWTNPRLYADEVVNKGTESSVGSSNQGTESSVAIQSESSVPFLIDHIFNTYKVELPQNLRTPEFADAWFEWEEYRKKDKKQKLTPLAVKKQIKLLSQYPADAKDMIDTAIRSSWQGIFAPKNGRVNRQVVNSPRPVEVYE